MRREKKICYLMALLCGMLSLTACSQKINTSEETPYYSMTIDGNRQYKMEDDEDVQQLRELALSYVDLSVNVDYQAEKNIAEELEYYTESYRSDYIEFGYIESSIEMAQYYEQVQELVESSLAEIQFYELNDEEGAWVACDYIAITKHATNEYQEDVGVKLDTKYKRTMTIGFIKENGKWKINEYDITPRVEVA